MGMIFALITVFFTNGDPPKTVKFESRYCESERAYISKQIINYYSLGQINRVDIKCMKDA